MDEKLTINREEMSGYILFHLNGRIDAHWSKYLDEALDNALRDREYNIALDMKDVEYLSSLGIRSLIKYSKLVKGVNGIFGITECSPTVSTVLNMVGLATVLQWKNPEKLPEEKKLHDISFDAENFNFKISRIEGADEAGNLTCSIMGNPEKLTTGFAQEDCKSEAFGSGRYGLGLGAIGSGFDDCQARFGEFAAFGNAVAFMPSGDVNTPDYMLTEGKLIPNIKMLYGILLEGQFSNFVRFSPIVQGKSISLSTLIEQISKNTGMSEFAMIMMAESTGMVGAALKRSPVIIKNQELFSFPEVKENLNLTTEPEYSGEISFSISVITSDPDSKLNKMTRAVIPLKSRSEGISVLRHHTHSAIFGYRPITKSELNIDDAVKTLFDEGKIYSLLHLINDRRDATGAGESEFSQGVCWIGKIEKQINK